MGDTALGEKSGGVDFMFYTSPECPSLFHYVLRPSHLAYAFNFASCKSQQHRAEMHHYGLEKNSHKLITGDYSFLEKHVRAEKWLQ